MTIEGVRKLKVRVAEKPREMAILAKQIREEAWVSPFFQETDAAPAWVGRLGSALVLMELLDRTDPEKLRKKRAGLERKRLARELREQARAADAAKWRAEQDLRNEKRRRGGRGPAIDVPAGFWNSAAPGIAPVVISSSDVVAISIDEWEAAWAGLLR